MSQAMPEPPPRLKALQEGFSEAIRTPFSFATGKLTCQTHLYPADTVAAIQPRLDENPMHRLAVYNEQYGFRLLTVMQEDFPLLAHCLGFWRFNQLAMAYLTAHPSRSPYLDQIPYHLPDFMRTHEAWAQALWLQAAQLDLAFLKAFHAPDLPALDFAELDTDQVLSMASKPLVFQPWFALHEEDWNEVEGRNTLLLRDARDAGDAQVAQPKIELTEKKGYWAIFREGDRVAWLPLEYEAFVLFREMQSGLSLADACEKAAAVFDEAGMQRMVAGIKTWFEKAVRFGWFCAEGTGLKPLID